MSLDCSYWERSSSVFLPSSCPLGPVLCDVTCHLVCRLTKYTVVGTALGPTSALGALTIGSGFSPTSMCGQPLGACALPELIAVEPHPLSAPENEAAMAGPTPPFAHMLTMGLLCWTRAPSYAHPQVQPGTFSSPIRLSLQSQIESCPWVYPLKPESQHPAAAHTSRNTFHARKCSEVARTVCAGLSLCCLLQASCCTLL